MRHHSDRERLDTTLGELIEAVSEIAFEYCDDAEQAYALAAAALVEILRNGRAPAKQSGDAASNRSVARGYLN